MLTLFRVLRLAGFWLCVFQASGLDLSKGHGSFSNTVWTQKDGLPQDAVSAIAQTSDGYLWLGTEEGLARFDGYDFTIFNKSSGKLPSNSITALATGSDGSLWIGTPNGLSHYSGGKFHTYSSADGLPDNSIADLFVDHLGRVWIVAAGAVAFFDGTKITLVAGKDASVSPRSIYEDSHGVIWVAGSKGLAELSDGTFVIRVDVNKLQGNLITRLVADRDNNIWLAGASGLMKYSANRTIRKYAMRDGLPDPHIRALRLDRHGLLWVGTSSGFAHGQAGQFLRLSGVEGRGRDVVRCIYEDLEGNLWVGTANGLMRFREDLFTTYGKSEGLPGDDPTALYQDHRGRIWVGFRENGLILFSPPHRILSTRNGLPSNEIFAIRETRDGQLLVGTREGLVWVNDMRLSTYSPPDELGRHMVFDALEDSLGRLWLALPAGLGELAANRLRIVVPGGSLNSDWVVSLLESSDKTLWAGTYGKGLWRVQGNDKHLFSTEDGLSSNHIRSLYQDKQGTLWIATDGGLNIFQSGRFTHVAAKDGLPSDNISGMVDDGETLWLGTTRGICRVSKKELQAYPLGKVRKLKVVTYGVEDGLRSAQCAPGYPRGGSWQSNRTSDGRLWFPTTRGLGMIDPKSRHRKALLPFLRLSAVALDGKAVRLSHSMQLPPGTESIHMRYVAIHLSAPERVQYFHKLEGVDSDWVSAGQAREASYNSLRPGKYLFLVRAELPGGDGSTQTEYVFEQLPQFHETTWFRLLCGIALIAAACGAYLLRIRQLRYRFNLVLEERARLAREIHDTLAQGFIGISSQLEAVSGVMAEDPSKALRYLDLARRMARHSITEARRSVFDLRASELEGTDLAEALRAGTESWTTGSGLTVHIEVGGDQRKLPDQFEQQLLRISQEAITNALKHAGASKISVMLNFDAKHVRLRISDDGQGFEDQNAFSSVGGHFGLIGMRERAEQLDGELRLTSCPGEGTQIEVTVPLP